MINFMKKHLSLSIGIFLAAAICIIYLKVVNYEFVNFDDLAYVSENTHVLSGLNIDNVFWAFTSFYAANWHPLTWLSHMLDFQIFGLNPGMHHLMNVIFHIANTILLFYLLQRMTGAVWRCAFVAALFGLHPFHVETVAWVAERKDVLSTFFGLLTLWAYIRYAGSPQVKRYLLVVLFFCLGLMAKPMLVTLPFLLLLLDYWPLHRFHLPLTSSEERTSEGVSFLRLFWEKLPLLALTVISSILTIVAQRTSGTLASLEVCPLYVRIVNAIVSYASYIVKMFWPVHLTIFYPYSLVLLPWWQVISAGVLLLTISLGALIWYRKYPWFIVGWLWYLGALVPVIGLVQVGAQAMADRYTYIPLIGLFMVISWGVPELLKGLQHRNAILASLIGTVLIMLTGASWIQTGYWENSMTLFEHNLKVFPHNDLVHYNLGVALMNQGDLDEAMKHYAEALKINPKNAQSHLNMGFILMNRGDYDEGMMHYTAALKIYPRYFAVYNNLGNYMATRGYFDEAIKNYMEAIRIDPHRVKVYNNIGVVFYQKGDFKKAFEYYQKALSVSPGLDEVVKNLEKAGKDLKEFEESISKTQEMIKVEPKNPALVTRLGDIYRQEGEYDKALVQYQKALLIQSHYIQAMQGLVLVYSNQQEYTKAIDMLQNIRKVQPEDPKIDYTISHLYAKENMVDESIVWLKQAIEKGFRNWDLIKTDPYLANIRNTSYVHELMKNH